MCFVFLPKVGIYFCEHQKAPKSTGHGEVRESVGSVCMCVWAGGVRREGGRRRGGRKRSEGWCGVVW